MATKRKREAGNAPIAIGILADVQYADKPDDFKGGGQRHYRLSLSKLREAGRELNKLHLRVVVHLGDIIDGNHSEAETMQDFRTVLRSFSRFHRPVLHVVGNHCLDVGRETLLSRLCSQAYFEHVLSPLWRIIVIDTTDVGLNGSTPELVEEGKRFLQENATARHAQTWNGGVGHHQLQWLRSALASCRDAGARCIVCGHMPVWNQAATDEHLVYNHETLVRLFDDFAETCALYLCGHFHKGGYARRQSGVHHLTCEGMVETEADAAGHAVLEVHDDKLILTGAKSPSGAQGVATRTMPLQA